ncbi:MAG: hypothetical protein AB8B58_13905 [Roseobacter sp.]
MTEHQDTTLADTRNASVVPVLLKAALLGGVAGGVMGLVILPSVAEACAVGGAMTFSALRVGLLLLSGNAQNTSQQEGSE